MNKLPTPRNTKKTTDVENVINEITTTWNKAAGYILQVASIINKHASYEDKDGKSRWKEIREALIERKIMSQTTISNLRQIAKKQILYENVNLLPPAYNTLWELSKLEEKELKEKFKKGLINPVLKLEEARQWKQIVEDDGIQVVEVYEEVQEKKKGITIFFSENDIIKKYSQIEENIKEIKKLMKYADIEISGLLKRKIDGD
jgi:hypothetical protein